MHKILCCLVALTSFTSIASHAEDDYPDFGTKPSERFSVSRSPYFIRPERALKNRIVSDKKNRSTNHFCIVGYNWASGNSMVWVHWKEERALILWGGSIYPDSRDRGLMTARRNLVLGKDTVETEDELNGSTYIETRAWWEGVAKDCDAHGEKFTVKPFSINKNSTP
ncbi:hypothetical protein [Paraherbaspirillum soli]|uniref:Uncharacterized protein n=1 Tax=Paraherbaspirillum soli TaxID=631222 RepID=A0ABW0M7P7_9BURK